MMYQAIADIYNDRRDRVKAGLNEETWEYLVGCVDSEIDWSKVTDENMLARNQRYFAARFTTLMQMIERDLNNNIGEI